MSRSVHVASVSHSPTGVTTRWSLALVGIALCVVPAFAHRPDRFHVQCPVCGHSFGAAKVVWFPDSNFGWDRDFLKHALGPQPFLLACWTCPKCLYTGLSDGFPAEGKPAPVTASITRLRKKNTLVPEQPVDPDTQFTDYIPAFVRYDLLIQTLLLDPATPPARMASAYMRAAQTQRFDWGPPAAQDVDSGLFKRLRDLPDSFGYDRDIAIARGLESLAADATNDLDARGRAVALASAAEYYKRRGEDPDAARVVALARKVGGLDAGVDAALKEIEVRIARERDYSLAAVAYLEKVMAEGHGFDDVLCIPKPASDVEAKAFCGYLVGVILRKAGDRQKALERLEPLRRVEGLPELFQEWTQDEIRKAKE